MSKCSSANILYTVTSFISSTQRFCGLPALLLDVLGFHCISLLVHFFSSPLATCPAHFLGSPSLPVLGTVLALAMRSVTSSTLVSLLISSIRTLQALQGIISAINAVYIQIRMTQHLTALINAPASRIQFLREEQLDYTNHDSVAYLDDCCIFKRVD